MSFSDSEINYAPGSTTFHEMQGRTISPFSPSEPYDRSSPSRNPFTGSGNYPYTTEAGNTSSTPHIYTYTGPGPQHNFAFPAPQAERPFPDLSNNTAPRASQPQYRDPPPHQSRHQSPLPQPTAQAYHYPQPNYHHPPGLFDTNPPSDEDDLDSMFASPVSSRMSSPEILPPPCMPAPPIFGTPVRSIHDMPLRGGKDAPKTFKGSYAEVQDFIQAYDKLLIKFRVTDPYHQCESILDYCGADVKDFIRASAYYRRHDWVKLRKEILMCYDAERAMSKYKPSDITTYTLKTTKKPFRNLTQWKRYLRTYKTISGTLVQRKQLTKDYRDGYFWLGIQEDLRNQLERQIFVTHPGLRRDKQYPMSVVDEAASWYFSRNRAETMMINASAYGVTEGDDDSDRNYGEDSDSDDDSDHTDYSSHRKRQKQRKAKQREKERARCDTKPEKGPTKSALKNTGTAEEVTGLI